MGTAYNAGNRHSFFKLWNKFVPFVLRQNDLTCQKLEFYLQIYFTVYPAFMANNSPEANQRAL